MRNRFTVSLVLDKIIRQQFGEILIFHRSDPGEQLLIHRIDVVTAPVGR